MGFVFGQIAGGFIATFTGPKPGIIFCMTVSAPLLMAVAADPLNMALSIGLLTTGSLFIGMMEVIAICTTSFPLRTQEDISTAGGFSSAIRAFGSILATVIYSTTLAHRLSATVPANVCIFLESLTLSLMPHES
jgi:predicted MFS family arabinose efflux permease